MFVFYVACNSLRAYDYRSEESLRSVKMRGVLPYAVRKKRLHRFYVAQIRQYVLGGNNGLAGGVRVPCVFGVLVRHRFRRIFGFALFPFGAVLRVAFRNKVLSHKTSYGRGDCGGEAEGGTQLRTLTAANKGASFRYACRARSVMCEKAHSLRVLDNCCENPQPFFTALGVCTSARFP